MSKGPVVMLLVPGRDALCLELGRLWPCAVLAALSVPFLSAMTARAYLAPSDRAPSLSAATASLVHALPPQQIPSTPERKAKPAAIVELGSGHEHGHEHEQPLLTASFARALPTLVPRKREATPQPSGEVIAAREVTRAFALRRDVLGLDDERAIELSRGELHVHAVHHGETLHARTFDSTGRVLANPLTQLRRLMRCRVTGDQVAIDPKLVRVLTQLSAAYERPLQLISGYRAPHTLGTSPRSQHALGRAADIRIRGVSLPALRKLAIELGARGVGLYPEKGFVHIDVRDKARYFWDYTSAHGETQYRPSPM